MGEEAPSDSSNVDNVFHQRKQWLRCGMHGMNVKEESQVSLPFVGDWTKPSFDTYETQPIVAFLFDYPIIATNNVLQRDVATPQVFETIAASHQDLTGKGPLLYRLGLGDYDGNTVIEFLQTRAACNVEFIDRRRAHDALKEQLLQPQKDDATTGSLKGFLVNVKGKRRWIPSAIYTSRHWYAIVQVRPDEWYIIDSSKDKVENVPDVLACLEEIQNDESLDANIMAVRETCRS